MNQIKLFGFFPQPMRWLLLLSCLLVATSIFSAASPALYAQTIVPGTTLDANRAVQVSPYLAAELAGGEDNVSILIVLADQPDLATLEAAAMTATTSAPSGEARRVARIRFVYETLAAHARQSQVNLRSWLDAQGIAYRTHYLINMISVTGDASLVEALRQRPDVMRLDANPQVDAMHVAAIPASTVAAFRWLPLLQAPEAVASPNTPYGVADVRAPEVWAQGYTGQGIVVASQDTGVEWDHPALRPRYRGTNGDLVDHTYNWLDAIANDVDSGQCSGLDSPCDDNGHGTHTVGTMVGSTNVITYGVAPGAQWMGCRNMENGVGTPESYTTCFEFFLAPYPPDGDPLTDGRPELAPHIINNSWGCPPSEGCNKDSLRQVVETVRAAGLMVVASAGNNGMSCGGVVDPIAIYDATFTVGAHDRDGNLGVFSSRGPVTADGSGRIKPDLTAPGVLVESTTRFGGAGFLSGTSMASPHVAGAVALLWSAVPWLVGEIDMTEQTLLKSATPVYSDICGESTAPISPNPGYGYGKLDVAAAVALAAQPWEVTVVVSDSAGVPVTGATLAWVDARTGYTHTATTNISGTATITPTLAGTYTLHVRGEDGTVTIDKLELVNAGTDGEPQRLRIDVLYDEAAPAQPSRYYMPGIYLRS